jgi:hypothetical protein
MIEVHPQGHHVIVARDDPLAVISLTWPEARALVDKLGPIIIDVPPHDHLARVV